MRALGPWLLLLAALGGPGAFAVSAQSVLPEALVLSPEPGERVGPGGVLVAASFIDPGGRLDPTSVTLHINGVDVTARAELSGGVLTWIPTEPLAPGPQRIVLRASDVSGAALDAVTWSFNVGSLADAPAGVTVQPGSVAPPSTRLRGTLIVEGAGQQVSGAGAPLRRGEDFLPSMWLNAGGIIRPGWRYATRVHMSGYESGDRQPVNRYRFDLRAPFMNLSAGDVNPVFHELVLSGRRVRGVQGELWAGPARISIVSGQSRRAIPGTVDLANPTLVDRYGTFGQSLFAVRPSFGSGRVFQLGLTMLRVRDDVESLQGARTQPGSSGGSTRSVNPAPKDNLVTGLDLTLRLAEGRLLLQYDNAVSLLANDISSGPLTEAGLDSILDAAGYDPLDLDPSRFERFFIVNAAMIPLDPRGLTNVAQQVRATVRAGSHLLSAEWRSVGGSYYTLGYAALQRDRAGIRIRDSFTALDDALVMSVGLERDQDNLDDVKLATTTASGVFANANWQAVPDGLALSGTVRVGTRANDLQPTAGGAIDEQTRMLSAGASIPVGQLAAFRSRVSLNASVIDREDPVNPQSGSRDLYLLGGLHGESASRETTGSVLLGVNRSELTGFSDATTNLYRFVATGRHRVAPQWIANLDGSLTAARSPEEAGEMGLDYDRSELLGGGEYEWMATTTIGFTAGVVSYADHRFEGHDTRELVARLRVSRSF